jgi:hypothetical protein
VEVDQGVGTGIALVFRQIEPDAPACYGHEPAKARLELMLPLLVEADALVPSDNTIGVLHTEDRHDLLFHRA